MCSLDCTSIKYQVHEDTLWKRWCHCALIRHKTFILLHFERHIGGGSIHKPWINMWHFILSIKCLGMIYNLLVKDCVVNHRMPFADILDLLSCMLCRKWNSFQHKTEGEEEVSHVWCYLSIWLSTFVLRGIITWCSADVNVPQCCLQRLLKEGRLKLSIKQHTGRTCGCAWQGFVSTKWQV